MKPKIIYDCSEQEYHASSGIGPDQWVTRSMLSCWDKSPRGFSLRYVQRHPLAQFKGNAGTSFGTIFDMLTTGEENRLIVTELKMPDNVEILANNIELLRTDSPINNKTGKPYGKDTKKYTEWLKSLPVGSIACTKDDAYAAECHKCGKIFVSQDDYDLAKLLLSESLESPMLRYIYTSEDRKHQVVVRWHDEETGLPLQVRIDTVLPNGLIDVKTGYKSPYQFTGSAVDYGYDLQASLYQKAWELATGQRLPFIFAYAQTKYPFECAPIQLEQRLIESAERRLRAAINGIAAKDYGQPHSVPLVPEVPAYVYFGLEDEEGEG